MVVEQIKPWIDLLTWQVLALVAGLIFAPAVYLLVFRIRRMKVGDNEFDLDRGEIKKLENAAERKAEDESSAQAAQEVDQLSKQNPADVAERMQKILGAWARIQKIARDKAKPHGGQDARAAIPNLTLLAQKFPNLISLDDVEWAQGLRDEVKAFEASPDELTASAYRSFAVSAGRLYKKVASLPDG